MKNIFKHILLLSITVLILFTGCSEEKKKTAKIVSPSTPTDTSCIIIVYSVSGTGSGNITLTKKSDRVKLELEKNINGEKNIETRYISDGWIYFYFTTESIVQPVKSRINKDQLYLKNFASLADAEEIILRAKKNGQEIIAGYVCDIYENTDGSKFSVYNSKYVLQSSFDGIVITANSINLNASVAMKDVEKPTNIEFLELTTGPL